MGRILDKITRYKGLVFGFANWYQFLLFKSSKSDSFEFRRRDGFRIEVPRIMLPVFKESFFDQVYLRGFPSGFAKDQKLTVLDIGANVGFFDIFLLSRFRNAKVFSYEPIPYNFQKMKAYKEEYGYANWHIFQKAVSDSKKPLTIFSRIKDGFSITAGIFSSEKRFQKNEVEATTFSELMSSINLEHMDLVKIDCEGSEYPIIYSWSDKDFEKVSNLVIETHPAEGPKNNHSELHKYLMGFGFHTKQQIGNGGTGYIWAWR